MADRPAVLHILLTDAFLAIGIAGALLTIEGVRVICGQFQAPAGARRPESARIASQKQLSGALDEIRENWLRLYAQDSTLLTRQNTREAVIAEQIPGQLLPELVRSMSQANSRRISNKKGFGFSVARTLSETPRIHTGPACFAFDPEQTRIEVHTALGARTPLRLPVVRLPFPFDRSREYKSVLRLLSTCDTVAVMPFSSDRARRDLIVEWNRYIEDAASIDWMPKARRVIWQRKDETESFTRIWVREAGNRVRKVDEGERASGSGADAHHRRPRQPRTTH